MGIVAEFAQSDDIGWDVTDKGWLPMLEELPRYTDVVLVATGERLMLYNRNYVKVKVVKEENNGSPIE